MVASTTLVTARDFAAAPRRTAEDALRLVPGVLLVQHGSEGKGYQFLVRGFDAAHGADFEASVEGIPINEWSNVHAQGYLDLGFVIPEVVSSVRVTKGPFTLGQGAFALAGSAAYHLGIEPEDRGLRVAYTLGSSNRHRALVTYSPPAGNGHDFIASETLHDQGFGSRRGLNKSAVLAKTELLNSERAGELSLLAAAYVARFELPGALRSADFATGRVGFDDSYADTSRGASMRGLVGLTYRKRSEHHDFVGTAHFGWRRLEVFENFTGYLFHQGSGDHRLQHQDSQRFGASVAVTSQLAPAWHSNVGLGVIADALTQEQAHADALERPIAAERRLRAFQALPYAFAGMIVRPRPNLRLDAGARLDVAYVHATDQLMAGARQSGVLAVPSPRAALDWQALPALRVLAAYGRGFRPPEARAFTSFEPAQVGISADAYAGGEPALTTSDSFELGMRYRSAAGFAAQLSVFLTLMARESVYDHVSGLNLELNATRRIGSELSLSYSAGDWLELGADATWVDARFVDSENPIPMAPTAFGSARAVLGSQVGPRAGLRFLGVLPRPLPNGATSSTLTRVDLTAGYHWPVWRIELEVENLLNQRIREGEYHFTSHWQPDSRPSALPVLHYVAGPPIDARLTLTAVF
jgi:outer membrane receptor protein involved in Fe transport